MWGKKTLVNTAYVYDLSEVTGKKDFSYRGLLDIEFIFRNQINYNNRHQLVLQSLKSIGSYLSLILTFWSVHAVIVYNKYKN